MEYTLALISTVTNRKTLCLSLSSTSRATDGFFKRLASEEATRTVPPIVGLRLSNMLIQSSAALSDAVTRFKSSLRSLHIGTVGFRADNWNDFFERIAQHQFTCLERMTAFKLAAPQAVYFCPLRLRQETLRSCGGVFEFTLTRALNKGRVTGFRYTGSPAGAKLVLKALGEESSYVLRSASGCRTQSPDLPDMSTYKGDAVGKLVDRQVLWRPFFHK